MRSPNLLDLVLGSLRLCTGRYSGLAIKLPNDKWLFQSNTNWRGRLFLGSSPARQSIVENYDIGGKLAAGALFQLERHLRKKIVTQRKNRKPVIKTFFWGTSENELEFVAKKISSTTKLGQECFFSDVIFTTKRSLRWNFFLSQPLMKPLPPKQPEEPKLEPKFSKSRLEDQQEN